MIFNKYILTSILPLPNTFYDIILYQLCDLLVNNTLDKNVLSDRFYYYTEFTKRRVRKLYYHKEYEKTIQYWRHSSEEFHGKLVIYKCLVILELSDNNYAYIKCNTRIGCNYCITNMRKDKRTIITSLMLPELIMKVYPTTKKQRQMIKNIVN